MSEEKKKRGRPSLRNAKIVSENIAKMSLTELANKVSLPEETVKELAGMYGKTATRNIYWKDYLRKSTVWKQLKKEFTEDELQTFEDQFAVVMFQFKDDVTGTEEQQILQLIKIHIMMGRNLMSRKQMQTHIDLMEKSVQDIADKYQGDHSMMDEKDRNYISDIERHLSGSRQALVSTSKEYREYQTSYNKILEMLKAARNQRVDKATSLKTSFTELVKSLMDKDISDNEGRQLELFKMGTVKELKRLSEPHKYSDGATDLPILTSESIEQLDEQARQEELLEKEKDEAQE